MPTFFGSSTAPAKVHRSNAGSRYGTDDISPAASPRSSSPVDMGEDRSEPSSTPNAHHHRSAALHSHHHSRPATVYREQQQQHDHQEDARLSSPPRLPVSPSMHTLRGNNRAASQQQRGQPEAKPEFMTGIIGMVNELQDIFSRLPKDSHLNVSLPQVAVIGSQSSGKSSVLESLVGRDFLPRDKEICTRRPLVLQLQQTQVAESSRTSAEWAEFLHKPGQRYTSYVDVRQEIEAETMRLTGSKTAVSAEPIILKIFSPHVLTMTLIDLPGITKVAIDDQPRNIEEILLSMTKKYIEDEACIILAVTPGNTDIANSEAIKLAQQVDPEGVRTLGVITKVDIMDEGTDVREYLLGSKSPKLKLGYVAVVNRSQKDINMNVPVGIALKAEQDWFELSSKGRPAYADIAAGSCGSKVLAYRINSLLKSHIHRMLPDLTDSLRSQERSLKQRLTSLGSYDISNANAAMGIVRRAVGRFEREFAAAIQGDAPGPRAHLYGGARIANQLKIFAEHLREILPRMISYTDNEIFHAIRNVYGVEGQMLMADKAFRHLMPPLVRRLEAPCQDMVGYVLEELQTIGGDAMKRVDALNHFPNLRDRVMEVTGMCLKESLGPTKQLVSNLISMEAGYINTIHPNFIGGQAAVAAAMEKVEQKEREREQAASRDRGRKTDKSPLSSKSDPRGYPLDIMESIHVPKQPMVVTADVPVLKEDKLKVETTRECLESYMDVVIGNLQDTIPKAIMLLLVNNVKNEKLGEYLNTHVNRPDMVEDLLQEEPSVRQERKRLSKQLEVISKAVRVIDRMPEKMRQSTAQMMKSVVLKE